MELTIKLYQRFGIKRIVEFFTTSKCERQNYLLGSFWVGSCQSEYVRLPSNLDNS